MGTVEGQRSRITAAGYDSDCDSVNWELMLPSGKSYRMSWARSQFGSALGINGVIPSELIEEFNRKMVGKVISLVLRPVTLLEGDRLGEGARMEASDGKEANYGIASRADLNAQRSVFYAEGDGEREGVSQDE